VDRNHRETIPLDFSVLIVNASLPVVQMCFFILLQTYCISFTTSCGSIIIFSRSDFTFNSGVIC
jgi:hypothetical protein